jgi:pentapeptide repeat protein
MLRSYGALLRREHLPSIILAWISSRRLIFWPLLSLSGEARTVPVSGKVVLGDQSPRANLRQADLAGADFTGAKMEATQISMSTLPQVEATATDTTR